MVGFLLALMLVFALALGGRDQWLVAQWSDALGQSGALLLIGAATATLSAGAMAWLGGEFAGLLPRRAAQMLVAFALAIAAAELAWPVKVKAPHEPTRSLGAIAIVLLARQWGDGARFAVFALAAWASGPFIAGPFSVGPIIVGFGGALGGAAAVSLGWSIGARGLAHWPLRHVRLALSGCLIVAALLIGLNARIAA